MGVYPCDGWHWCITQETLQWDHCSLSLRVVMWIQRVNADQLNCTADVEHQLAEVLKLWFLSHHSDSFDHATCGSNHHNCILDISSMHYNFVFNIWNNPQFLKIQVILVSFFLLSQYHHLANKEVNNFMTLFRVDVAIIATSQLLTWKTAIY